MQNNYSIYISHHKPTKQIDMDGVYPIHVGKSLNLDTFCVLDDASGDHISYKNEYYCELTAQYWVWKNRCNSDYIGFMHYRRHLNLQLDKQYEEDIYGHVNAKEIDAAYLEQIGFTEENFEKIFANGDIDIIIPNAWDTRNVGEANNYDLYKHYKDLHIHDYENVLEVLQDLYPEYSEAIKKYNMSSYGYYTNMFVMKRELFEAYSQWLFSILDNYEKIAFFRDYNTQEKRAIGHITERLFGIYITRLKEENPKLNIYGVNRTFVQHPGLSFNIRPLQKNAVPIVICFDNNYSLSVGALISSISSHARKDLFYDIVIFADDISFLNKKRFLFLTREHENISIRFVPIHVQPLMAQHTRGHFSATTYARLFIPDIMKAYDKVIFIDADTVVETDLAQLMNIDMGTHFAAAVKDVIMEGFVNFDVPSDRATGGLKAREYLLHYLELKNVDHYFQAGVMLFNIKQMNIENIFEQLMKVMQKKVYWFVDQDIMNIVFENKVFYLPPEWNVVHGNGNTDELCNTLHFASHMRYIKSRENPKVIHFAGENKPWVNHAVDFSDNFYKYLKDTPWINHSETEEKETKKGYGISTWSSTLKNKSIKFIKKVFPPFTKRRATLYKVHTLVRKMI